MIELNETETVVHETLTTRAQKLGLEPSTLRTLDASVETARSSDEDLLRSESTAQNTNERER